MSQRLLAALLLAAGLSTTASATAEPTAQERALAEALFREARTLATRKAYDAACPKFAESQRLDPQLGTLLHLATCHEQQGKTASAWVEYTEAGSIAQRTGHAERRALAVDRATRLEAVLSRVTVDVEQAVEGQRITLDGQLLGPAVLGTPLPVDPGEHELRASAPSHEDWATQITVPEGPSSTTAVVPALVRVPEPLPPPPPADGTGQRVAGYVVGATGLVGLGVGAGFGLLAASQAGDADVFCQGRFCTEQGLAMHEDARTSALVSTVAFAAGGAAVALGLVLVLTAPGDADDSTAEPTARGKARLWAAPGVVGSPAGVSLGGAW